MRDAGTLPRDLDDLDPGRMTRLLARRRSGVRVTDVRVVERARCGDGVASTADRVLLELTYAPGADAGLPRRMILKTLLLNRLFRFGHSAIVGLKRAVGVAERLPGIGARAAEALFVAVGRYQERFPHAPDAMYRNEVRFYDSVRDELPIEAPATHGAFFDDRTRHFGVLMEDLRERGARFPNALESQDLGTVRDLLGQLAAMHARHWNGPRLSADLSWIPTRLAGGMFPVFDGIGYELIRYQVDTHESKAALLAPLGRDVETLWRDLWRSQRILDGHSRTLLHGDPHIGNTYVLPDGHAGLLDFQLLARGCFANDVGYLVATALDSETRRNHERELLAFYRNALAEAGVKEPPSADEAWDLYRLAMIWGLVIGWLITPPVNYGEAITSANIARMVTACRDLDAFALAEGSEGTGWRSGARRIGSVS